MALTLSGVRLVAVGSKNPAKVRGVEAVLRRLGCSAEVRAVPVETSVGPQPVGLPAVIRGAVERAVEALKACSADLGVGIEAGLVEVPGTISGYMDFQACAVADKDGGVTLGFSPGFEFPTEAVRAVVEGRVPEIEAVMERISGIQGIGDKEGAIGFLTRGLVRRVELSELAFIMALVPRLNPGLYSEPLSYDRLLSLLY